MTKISVSIGLCSISNDVDLLGLQDTNTGGQGESIPQNLPQKQCVNPMFSGTSND